MPVNSQFSITGNPLDPQQQPQDGKWYIPDTTGAFQFDDAIRRRLDSVQEMNNQADQNVAQQAAVRAQQQQMQAQQAYQQSGYRQQQGQDFGQGQGLISGAAGDIRSKLVAAVAQYKGTPYVWGGSAPGGFDCSGLIQFAYKQMGINMPRVSQQQAQMGRVVPFNQLKPGDLVGWGKSPATAHHIAVYAGNGMIWEAPRPGKAVQLRPLGQWSADNTEAFGIALNL